MKLSQYYGIKAETNYLTPYWVLAQWYGPSVDGFYSYVPNNNK